MIYHRAISDIDLNWAYNGKVIGWAGSLVAEQGIPSNQNQGSCGTAATSLISNLSTHFNAVINHPYPRAQNRMALRSPIWKNDRIARNSGSAFTAVVVYLPAILRPSMSGGFALKPHEEIKRWPVNPAVRKLVSIHLLPSKLLHNDVSNRLF